MLRENISRMSKLRIQTVRQLVDAFGGTGKLAEFLKIVPSAVSNMLADDYIPRGYHLELYFEARRRGWQIDTQALFGVSEQSAREPVRAA
jgi:hypothetical protein